ncbi:TlpA family protein disulfide reductase [Chryseobacterium manosquense]|uniref:TlpA family protein disulfide reductase n=1 Tax=Chryseobacterium manosquense TaxID=2754694 RepID=A0A7H1DXD1_9FLAO|nr:TlpA family protein disulfide reductase [Chryseobacterium manosquense]
MINGTKETISLSDFKERLVILEFWASNCSACLKNIPKVAEINNQFKNRAIILPISEQPKSVIAKFFQGDYGRKYTDLISVTDDSILGKYFPHYGVPYLIWIYDGKVMSTTDAGQLSAESVSDILQEKKSSLKNIQQMDASKPLFLKPKFRNRKKRVF